MSANSYKKRSIDGWRNMTGDYTGLDGFGWDRNGLRGHIYANAAQSLVVIGFKGTSTLLMGGGTVGMDKYMDNVMFSCCCARVDISWIPICGCYLGRHVVEEEEARAGLSYKPLNSDDLVGSRGRCNQTCLLETVRDDPDSYYNQAVKIVKKVTANYPDAQIWFTGHSLGGAIASLMAVTFDGTAAVTFEAPGDRLYAARINLAQRGPFWSYPIWNFGITSDPVFMGTCQGPTTTCYLSGYALETRCRHGRECVIEVPGGFDVTTHRIDWVIDNVLQGRREMPQCRPRLDCEDCVGWAFE
jgi:lipase ATG15